MYSQLWVRAEMWNRWAWARMVCRETGSSVMAGTGFYLGRRVAQGPDVKRAGIQPALGSLYSAGASGASLACQGPQWAPGGGGPPAWGAWPHEAGQIILDVGEQTA